MGDVSISSSSLKPSWSQIIHIVVILLICLIVTPIMIYWTLSIYRKRSTIIMQKRYIGLSILSCCLSILWIFCGVPMFIWHRFLLQEESPMKLPVGVALSNLYPILGHGIMYTLLIRFFMLFFHLNWTRVTLSSHWIIHIRKPSSKDVERENRLIALQQQQQREQAEKLQKQKQKEANNINKTKHHKHHRGDKTKNGDNKRHALNPHNYVDDLQNGFNKMENSGNHLHPTAQKKTGAKEVNHSSDDKTIAIHNHIKFPSQITASWYIKNRPKYASHQRILRRAYPVLLIEICVIVFISVMAAYSLEHSQDSYWPNIQYITNFILWLIPCVASIYLFLKLPSNVADSFFYKDEMRNLLIVNIINSIILFSEMIVIIVAIFIPIPPEIDFSIKSVTNEVFVIFSCMANVYFQSEWLLKRIKKQIVKLNCDFFNEPYQYNANPHLAHSMYREAYSKTGTGTGTDTAPTLSPAFNIPVPALEMPRIEENVVTKNNNNNNNNDNNNDNNNNNNSNTNNNDCENNNNNNNNNVFDDIKQPESPGTDAGSLAYREPADDVYETQMYRILFFTLQSYKLFNDFTSYLASELSMECSFAFIEFTQFKVLMDRDVTFMQSITTPIATTHYAYSAMDPNVTNSMALCERASNSSSSTYSYNLVKLPRTISRSSIVHNKKYARMQTKFRFRKIAKKLTEKYLESGAEFELAISSARKKEVIAWVANHCRHLKVVRGSRTDPYSDRSRTDPTLNYSSNSEQSSKCSSKTSLSDQLYHLFEDCRKEIYYLMAHSCDRFVKTEAKKRDILKDHVNE